SEPAAGWRTPPASPRRSGLPAAAAPPRPPDAASPRPAPPPSSPWLPPSVTRIQRDKTAPDASTVRTRRPSSLRGHNQRGPNQPDAPLLSPPSQENNRC